MSIKSLLNDFRKIESITLDPRYIVLIISENIKELEFRLKSLENEYERQHVNLKRVRNSDLSMGSTDPSTFVKELQLFKENQQLDIRDATLLLENIERSIIDLREDITTYRVMAQKIVATHRDGEVWKGFLRSIYNKTKGT